LYGIGILRPQDRFNVISFAGEDKVMEAGLVAADEQGRKRGEAFVQALRPAGGTNINQALLTSMQQFQSSDRPKILVFMTDGLPTVGETNAMRIVENSRTAKVSGLRIFTFGVGYDVNTSLLDKLAAENGGVADYVEPQEDIEVKVSNFFAKINHPVLTDLRLDLAGVETDLLYPRALPDIFKGSQLTIIGRYKNPGQMNHVRLGLNGNSRGASRTLTYNNLSFPLREDDNDFLPRLWATRRVGWLMEQVRMNGEQQELRDEIVDLGTRYGIVTPYTSYLALEPSEAVSITGARRDNRGFASGRLSNAPVPAPPPRAVDMNATTGQGAVTLSKQARAKQEVARVEEETASSMVRNVGGKTFYLRDDVWTDSEFKSGLKLPETVIKFGSDEYFALLQQKRQLGDFFSLGEQVLVVFEGRIYKVIAAGN
jgi:Ca-activated chloride channel family protein